jgi:hypothetical protein
MGKNKQNKKVKILYSMDKTNNLWREGLPLAPKRRTVLKGDKPVLDSVT